MAETDSKMLLLEQGEVGSVSLAILLSQLGQMTQ